MGAIRRKAGLSRSPAGRVAVARHTIQSQGPDETGRVGERLGRHARPGDLYLLYGDLGAGKTCLTQGIARGLGITEPATSPTFTLVNLYRGRLPLYHVDLYRIESAAEAEDLGLEELIADGGGVTAVEWPERAEPLWPPERLEIRLARTGDERREIVLVGIGERYAALLRDAMADGDAAGD